MGIAGVIVWLIEVLNVLQGLHNQQHHYEEYSGQLAPYKESRTMIFAYSKSL